MKRVMILVLLINGYGVSQVRAQTVTSFNFSMTPQPVAGWTNVAGDPNTAIRTATANGITVSSVDPTHWAVVDGLYKGDGLGMQFGTYFPSSVMVNFWAQYQRPATLFNVAAPQLKISGLNKDSNYYIRMTGSFQYPAWDCDPVQYTVTGRTLVPSQYLNTFNNTTMGVTFQHITPDTNGVIFVYVNTTNESDMADISGIQIISGSATIGMPAVAITSPADNNILPEESNITIAATASETGSSISKVEFFANDTKIGEANAAPYTMIWMNPNEGHYLITAKATDAAGTTQIATIHISIESLTSFWSMTGNIGMNADSNFVGNVDSVRLAFRTKNIERMSISPIGNIGIGTIAPTAQLHTTGTVRLAGLTSDSTKNRVVVSDTSGNLFYRNVSSLSNRWLYANGTLYDSTDNIAIGTNNPQGYKLAVNGTAIFTKVRVKTAGTWPDYVFKKGYSLPGLEELERYVTEYKHLPGIASESDVQRDGIDVGEHQAALLKKMEEMTLYLIEENKKLKEQNKQLEEQHIRLEQQQQQIDELKKLIGRKK